MEIGEVLEGLDQLFANRESNKVEDYLSSYLEKALKEGDAGSAITIINELIGFYRDTSQYDKAEAYCEKLLPFMERAGLEGTIHYGTSCLNIANAYRASGRLEDSLAYYQKVFQIYEQVLDKKDFRYASLYNNLSLLYQEMQQYEKASEALCSALEIVKEYPEAVVEQAVTYTNLAASYVKADRLNQAKEASKHGLAIFEDGRTEDYHYSAALSVAGDIQYASGEYDQAVLYYEQAMFALKQHVGVTHAYFRIISNLQLAYEKAGHAKALKGMTIAEDYYNEYGGRFREALPDIVNEIAFAKVGEGSECFGLDDLLSKDHDFGPGFCVFVTCEQYEVYGRRLEQIYEELPDVFRGFSRPEPIKGAPRNGIIRMEDFFGRILELNAEETAYLMKERILPENVFLRLDDWQLKTVTNGTIFSGQDTIFGDIYHQLKKGYPDSVWRRKLAQVLGHICQDGQYNYERLMKRQDTYGATLMLQSFEENVVVFLYLINRVYAPHKKWMMKEAATLEKGQDILRMIKDLMEMKPDAESYQKREPVEWIGKKNTDDQILQKIDQIAEKMVALLREEELTESSDSYLEGHIPYLLKMVD